MIAKEIKKELLCDLYLNKGLTSFEIGEILQINQNEIKQLLIKYKIDDAPKNRKYELIRKTSFTKDQKSFIIGCILGFGKLSKHGKDSYRLDVFESDKNKILKKKAILGDFVNLISKKNDKYGFSIIHHDFKNLYDLLYDNHKKTIKLDLIESLNSIALSVLIMDRGDLKNVNLKLQTYEFSEKENENLQYMLKVKFDIKSKICKYNKSGKEYCYLSINKENMIKLSKIVEKHFDNHIGPSTTTC